VQNTRVIEFFKFVFGGVSVQKRFHYNAAHEVWCPLCLKWTNRGGAWRHDGKAKIWIRRARRWFQGKRDHQVP
jgi:hypothetical protein